MVSTANSPGLTLISKPYQRRVGLLPMIAAMAIGFLFSLVWFGVAAWMVQHRGGQFSGFGWLIILATSAYCIYLAVAAFRLFAESQQQYRLELTANEAVLSVTDKLRNKKSTQMVLLSDVKYAEYYPFLDSSSIILHTAYADMEIPLWPLGAQAQDALDFLEGRGVHVVNVQSDERIPL
jgi:hypothetical protein